MRISPAFRFLIALALLLFGLSVPASAAGKITARWSPNFTASENTVSVTNRSGQTIQISPAFNREYGTSPAITWKADKSYSPDLISITFYFVGASKPPDLGANGQPATPIALPTLAQTDIKFQMDDTMRQMGKDSSTVILLLSRDGKIFFRESLRKVNDQWKSS